MIVKILGMFDILLAILLLLSSFSGLIPGNLLLILGIILLAKGLFFVISDHIASVIDIVCAVLIMVSIQTEFPFFIRFLIVIYLLQKGIISLL